jgi:rhodanese-related sulfurtransferase
VLGKTEAFDLRSKEIYTAYYLLVAWDSTDQFNAQPSYCCLIEQLEENINRFFPEVYSPERKSFLMPGLLCESRAEQAAVADMSLKCPIVSSDEVAEKIQRNENRTLLIDCRSLFAFTSVHIKGAIHVNCSSIGRKRLLQGKTKLKDLISSREGKEKYISSSIQSFVVYDELTSSEDFTSSKSAICIVLQTLSKEGKDISLLKGEKK